MFDADGDFIHDHDLEAGLWDGHGYDCPTPVDSCTCDDTHFDFEDDEDSDSWPDLATYFAGR